MKTLYDKLMDATDSVGGNVRNDPGVIFLIKAIAESMETGVCEECKDIVSMVELKSNAGICGVCVMKGGKNAKDS